MIDKKLELDDEGQARRRFLKQAATVAWASPFIVTMMSRAAHASHNTGAQCGTQDPSELGGCLVTAPCGTPPHQCVPDVTAPGIGNPCVCVP